MADAQNQAIIRITADDRLLDGILARTVRKMHAWGVSIQNVIKSSMRGIGDITGFEGIGGIAQAINQAKRYSEAMLELSQTARLSGAEQLQLRAKLDQVAIATGVNQEELLAAVDTYHKFTGKGRDMVGMLDEAAKVAIATATPIASVANVMARLRQNAGLSADEMTQMFDVLSAQSDRGAIKMKDMAEVFPTLLGSLQAFGGSPMRNVADMDAMLQMIMQVSGDPSQAATRLDDLMNMIKTRSGKLEDAGISVFSDAKKTKLKPLQEIVEQLIKLPRGHLDDVMGGKDEGDVTGRRKQVILALDALRERIVQERELAGLISSRGDIERKADQATGAATFGFKQFNAVMTKSFNDLLLGRLRTFATILQEIAKIATVLFDHPLTTLLPAIIAFKRLPSMLATMTHLAAASGALGPGGKVDFGQVTNVYVVGAAPGVLAGLGTGGAAEGAAAAATRRGPSVLQIASAFITAASLGATIGTLIAESIGLYSFGNDPNRQTNREQAWGWDVLHNAGLSRQALFGKATDWRESFNMTSGKRDFRKMSDSEAEEFMARKGSAAELLKGFTGQSSANEAAAMFQRLIKSQEDLTQAINGAGSRGVLMPGTPMPWDLPREPPAGGKTKKHIDQRTDNSEGAYD